MPQPQPVPMPTSALADSGIAASTTITDENPSHVVRELRVPIAEVPLAEERSIERGGGSRYLYGAVRGGVPTGAGSTPARARHQ